MKNLLLIFTLGLFTSITAFGQDAFKDLKNADKAISKYINDNTKADELTKGIQLLESAFASDEVKALAKSWITKGKMLNSLAGNEMKNKTLDVAGTYVITAPNAAADAYDAYEMAAKLSEKKNEKKEIQIGLTSLENNLNNFAIVAYQAKDYATAFTNFTKSIKAGEMLKSMGKASRLDDPEIMKDQNFFAAVSAYYSENFDGARPFLTKLADAGTDEPFVYEALYTITADADTEKALGFLAKGREIAPDDTGLLFAEINHYLKAGELNILIGKLETALEKEPDNVSIYNTIGSVYDQLQQQEEDAAKSAEYREKAKGYYESALEKDPANFDAQYSIGALYYNKAASYVDRLNDLSADLTPAGMKKYDEVKGEMDGLFETALPYFQQAETLNGKDRNTIIALKEIYARLNNLEKSNEYKAKFEAMQAGQ